MNIRGRLSYRKLGEGYTILEVLIFLAVSALIFVGAITAINGRQDQVQFTQSTREFESKIADLINDVSTGYFPAFTTIECTIGNDGKINIDLDLSNNVGLGSSEECIYIGKALHFAPSEGPSSNPSKLIIYNVVGKKFSDEKIVTSLKDAGAKAVAEVSGGGPTPPSSENYPIEEYELRYNLKVTKIFEEGVSDKSYSVVGLFSDLGGGGASASGDSQLINVGIISDDNGVNAFAGYSTNQAINLVNKLGVSMGSGPHGKFINSGVVVCLKFNDDKNKKASLTIGSSSGSSTNLQIDDYDKGCDV